MADMKEADIRPAALFNQYLELARSDVARFFSDTARFVEVRCPACASWLEEEAFQKDGFRYVTCGRCGSLYVSPRPVADMFEAYYRESASVRFWSTDFFKETAEARREKMFRPRARLVAELLTAYSVAPPRTCVDVGAGYGIFLEEANRLGAFNEVIGIEPAPNLAEVCRTKGFRVIERPAEAVVDLKVRAAVVTAFELLEHVFDPAQFLRAVRRMLRPDGLFVLTTLTISGFDLLVLWERSKSISPPHHINFLSVEGMRELLGTCGFEIVELATPGQLDVDILRNAMSEDRGIELPRFVRYVLTRRAESTYREFQEFLQRNALSSHVRVIARQC